MRNEITPAVQREREKKAFEDFHEHYGLVVRAHVVRGYIGDDSVDITFRPPIAVRITGPLNPDCGINHWNDEWLDPYWDVSIVEPWHPQLQEHPLRSCWIDGPSYDPNGDRQSVLDWRYETWGEWCRRVFRSLFYFWSQA